MKNFYTLALTLLMINTAQAAVGTVIKAADTAAEDYKTFNPNHTVTLGVAGGLGLIDTTEGFTLIGSAGVRLVPDGFIPDIVNPVFLELQFGPMFARGSTLWMYSTHLRWDFVKDNTWTLFALGGFGGNISDNVVLGDRVAFHPRFGIGAFYDIGVIVMRFDFSHELVTAGVSYPF
jgi:hypothetical protein